MPKGANCRELLTVVLASMGIILISVLRDFLIMNLLSSFSEKQEAGVAFSFTVKCEGNEARGADSSGAPREDVLPGGAPASASYPSSSHHTRRTDTKSPLYQKRQEKNMKILGKKSSRIAE